MTGRPTAPVESTEDHRRLARAMAGFGLPHADIAVLLDISVATLLQYFQDDLDRGVAEGNAKVAQSLFHMATVEKSVAAAIFWLKARAGWSEKLGFAGGDGPRLVVRVFNYADEPIPPKWSPETALTDPRVR